MKYNFQAKAKMAAMTGAEVGVVVGSALLSQKFLDFKVLFKDKIAADPAFAEKWFIKHQGAIKFGVGVLAAVHIPNPWLRLIAVGVAFNGLVQEVRVLTTKDDGTTYFNAIGSNMDARLRAAAESARRGMNGRDRNSQVFVAGTDAAPTFVALPIDLMNNNYTSVGAGNYMMERGMGVAMMR